MCQAPNGYSHSPDVVGDWPISDHSRHLRHTHSFIATTAFHSVIRLTDLVFVSLSPVDIMLATLRGSLVLPIQRLPLVT